MATKRAVLEFDSDTNQLEYQSTPGTYINSNPASTTYITWEDEQSFDSDMVPQINRRFFLTWPALNESYSPVYARFRIRSESYNSQSLWSIPQLLHVPVRYAVYKRRVVNQSPNKWVLVEVTTNNSVGGYQENWEGRVQYAVSIYHKNSKPAATEGVSWSSDLPTDVVNPYVLFMTNPDDPNFNTRPNTIIQL